MKIITHLVIMVLNYTIYILAKNIAVGRKCSYPMYLLIFVKWLIRL